MKQLGLLIVGAFLFVACDSKPGGNKGILPIVHENEKEVVEQAPATEESLENDTIVEENQPIMEVEATEEAMPETAE
ncbi:MAG TPA: hypothetical protein VL022_03320 [Moheibacter sp.]|nr:hypothetical protein [Moheibacter sp.]